MVIVKKGRVWKLTFSIRSTVRRYRLIRICVLYHDYETDVTKGRVTGVGWQSYGKCSHGVVGSDRIERRVTFQQRYRFGPAITFGENNIMVSLIAVNCQSAQKHDLQGTRLYH